MAPPVVASRVLSNGRARDAMTLTTSSRASIGSVMAMTKRVSTCSAGIATTAGSKPRRWTDRLPLVRAGTRSTNLPALSVRVAPSPSARRTCAPSTGWPLRSRTTPSMRAEACATARAGRARTSRPQSGRTICRGDNSIISMVGVGESWKEWHRVASVASHLHHVVSFSSPSVANVAPPLMPQAPHHHGRKRDCQE